MHELAISETICKIVEKEATKHGIAKIISAKLKIGVMNAFQRDNLDLCLKKYANNPLMAEVRFEIEEVPVKLECTKCDKRYNDTRFDDPNFAHDAAHATALYLPLPCPSCGSEEIIVLSGNEMELASIEG